MIANIKMAWRNIWRNKRRTLITVASIFFGVLLSSFMTSMQEGTYSRMIDNVVGFYSGYIQIHDSAFWDNKTIEYTFVPEDSLIRTLNTQEGVTSYVSRLESFTLLSFKNNTKGAPLIGIEPEKENQVSKLGNWIVQGQYLGNGDNGILLAVNLAKNLGVNVGDTLVLLSQGYHGVSAAGLFPVKGILKFPAPSLNNLGAFIDIHSAQDFFTAPDRFTSIVLMVTDYSEVNHIEQSLKSKIGKHYEVMTWDEMDPLTKNMIDADRSGGYIAKAILYLLIGFGIFGTVIMMIAERRKEMGVMVAIGMQKRKLSAILFYETTLIGLVGVLAGFLFSFPFIYYFVSHPIPITGDAGKAYEQWGFEPAMFFSAQWFVFARQVLIVFLITLAIYVYPLVRTYKLKLTKALHS
ncbi:MAG: ABC transporter permease [Prolixibacteraceae bacterium]|nr:ABC transporter permease [Prolixibacteraceae bacterium]MBN2773234.1 ABC transporter permease [Prolixibacteraceae bacterium]